MGVSSLPHRRRRAREIALQLIYELDLRPDLTAGEAIEMFPWGTETNDVTEYAKALVLGVFEYVGDIDAMLREHIVGWRTERMVAVDRASIRMALFEGLIGRKVRAQIELINQLQGYLPCPASSMRQ